MLSVVQIDLGETRRGLELDGEDTGFSLVVTGGTGLEPRDVDFVSPDGSVMRCRGFAGLAPDGKSRAEETERKPRVITVQGCAGSRFIAVLGEREIIYLDADTGRTRRILELFRAQGDDRRVYSLRVEILERSFLVLYESGAAHIGTDGSVAWHVRLAWDDVLYKKDDELLYYVSAISQDLRKGFTLRIEDGARSTF